MEEDKSVLDKLLGVVQGYKSNQQTGKGGWIATAVVGILALIAVALFAWQQWKAGKERAKLLHEKAVREEEAHQATVDVELAENQQAKEDALQQAHDLQEEVARLEDQTEKLEARRQAARAAIDKISSWEDVDAIVR